MESLLESLVIRIATAHEVGDEICKFFGIQRIDQARWHLRNRDLIDFGHLSGFDFDRLGSRVRWVNREVLAVLNREAGMGLAVLQRHH